MRPKPQHAAAHIVTSLDAVHEIGEWHEPHGTVHHVAHADEENPGILKHARLGPSGLQLMRVTDAGEIAVCIPLPLLFALAAEINPSFNAPPDAILPEKDLEKLAVQLVPAAPAAD